MNGLSKIMGNDLIKKIEYYTDSYFYYAVPFHKSKQSEDELTICVSSQIGCPMKCTFCATGDMPFVRNISSGEISEQILDGFSVMNDYVSENNIKNVKLIAEGMGDASFNIANIVAGFQGARSVLFEKYRIQKVDFGISTIGNVKMIPIYQELALKDAEKRTNYDFQISLHSANDVKRKSIIPNMPMDKTQGKELTLHQIFDQFSRLAKALNQPMKFNYMLLQNNDWDNYSNDSIEELIGLCKYVKNNDLNVKVKLTKYSDTGKTFFSPDDSVYTAIIETLAKEGVFAYYVPLIGSDIRGACGQLHYTQNTKRGEI